MTALPLAILAVAVLAYAATEPKPQRPMATRRES